MARGTGSGSAAPATTTDAGEDNEITVVRIEDIVKRERAWCVRRCGQLHKMKGSYILEECPGCGSSAIKWSGIRNKRQSTEVSTLRCNRQGRGRCDHADARRRIQARAENRAKINSAPPKPQEPLKRKQPASLPDEPPLKAMSNACEAFAPKMYTLAAAALHLQRMDIKHTPKQTTEPASHHPAMAEPAPDFRPPVSHAADFRPPVSHGADFRPPVSHAATAYNPYIGHDPFAPPYPHKFSSSAGRMFSVPMDQHRAAMQYKHDLMPPLMLQQAMMRGHNPQVQQQPYAPYPSQLCFQPHHRLATEMNPQTGM